MERSTVVKDALLGFYEVFSGANTEDFGDLISRDDEGILVIGTDPGDWVEGRERWIVVREAMRGTIWEGVKLVPGPEPRGYRQGPLGWVNDRPAIVMEDGTTIPARLTGVVREEEGVWRFVHVHLSVAVPDEEVVELQQRWSR